MVANKRRINPKSFDGTLLRAQKFSDEVERLRSELEYLEELIPLQAKLIYALRDKRASNTSFTNRREAYEMNVSLVQQETLKLERQINKLNGNILTALNSSSKSSPRQVSPPQASPPPQTSPPRAFRPKRIGSQLDTQQQLEDESKRLIDESKRLIELTTPPPRSSARVRAQKAQAEAQPSPQLDAIKQVIDLMSDKEKAVILSGLRSGKVPPQWKSVPDDQVSAILAILEQDEKRSSQLQSATQMGGINCEVTNRWLQKYESYVKIGPNPAMIDQRH